MQKIKWYKFLLASCYHATMIDKTGWVYCPICHSKTKTKVNKDTEMHNFPLFCPKCKQESRIDVEKMELRLSK